MLLLDGKKAGNEIKEKLAAVVQSFSSVPKLVVLQVGEREDSTAFIRQKRRFAEAIGVTVEHIQFTVTSTEQMLIEKIMELNLDSTVHGIILQIPLPHHLVKERIVEAIDPVKDVDGLTAVNFKHLVDGSGEGHVPATARGIITLLTHYNIPIAAKKAVIIGRSTLVGKPTALTLLNHDATVTVVHRKTVEAYKIVRDADILVVAAGVPHLINASYVREGQVVIDVGITVEDGVRRTIVGDVDFDAVKNIVSAISPVPGGVGPMTVASLFENLCDAYKILTKTF